MIDVIFVGDSFSDDGKRTDLFDIHSLKTIYNYYSFGFPTNIKLSTFLALDVLNQNKENVRIHTLGRGSYGNHVIYDKLKQKVFELKNENPNNKIYAIIQLSAFIRNGNINVPFLNVEDYPYDYVMKTKNSNYNHQINLFEKHLDNIENIHNFCLEQNVEKYMYFGWSVIFKSDFKFFKLEHRIETIQKIVNFFPYEDGYDEMENYCSGIKPHNKTDGDLFFVHGDIFGGQTEYIRKKIPVGERYFMRHDAHLSTRAYQVFYQDIIRKWFIEKNIIDDINLNEEAVVKIENGIKWEKMRYDILTNSSHFNSKIIYDNTFNMFRGNQIDFNYCEKKFNEINNNIKNTI
jgi:hypothetical protein